eukprot:1198979-Pleurochrysis_carterae.AAC.1
MNVDREMQLGQLLAAPPRLPSRCYAGLFFSIWPRGDGDGNGEGGPRPDALRGAPPVTHGTDLRADN